MKQSSQTATEIVDSAKLSALMRAVANILNGGYPQCLNTLETTLMALIHDCAERQELQSCKPKVDKRG